MCYWSCGVFIRDKSYIKCAAASIPPAAADNCPTSIGFARNTLTFDAGEIMLESADVVEKFALGRGAAIKDVDGNEVFYAFEPVTAQ